MKLYIIRHGKTDWNNQKLIQGSTDLSLSDIGKNEILKFKNRIDKLDFDMCISSPLKRAKETAEIVVPSNCKILTDDRLKERYMGKLEGTTVKNYDIQKFWNINYEKEDIGVETPKEILKRAHSFLEDIKKDYKDKNILIVSHSGLIKGIHYNIVGYDDNTDLLSFYANHNEIYEYDIK